MPDIYRKQDSGVREDLKSRTDKPKLFRVLLHNDDYTTMEFVTVVLETIFEKSPAEAYGIMMKVHTIGVGVAGIYVFEVAETKVALARDAANDAGFPLRCTIDSE